MQTTIELMFSSLFRWPSASLTPQEEFKKLHATLSTPPLLPSSAASRADDSIDALTATAHMVRDPYHLIICQHGVLSTSADFENVITDLFVHHEVSVFEAAELAKAAADEQATTANASFPPLPRTRTTTNAKGNGRASPTESPEVAMTEESSAEDDAAGLPFTVPNTSMPTVTFSASSSASPRAAVAAHDLSVATALTKQQQHPLSADGTGEKSNQTSKACADPLRPDTALTQAQRSRRDGYKKTFQLTVEHPNRTNGRLYRSGNLSVFSAGSNNYLRSDAGTLACAQKMLAETVPQLHAWLDDVEARERQRRARWSVYARLCSTPESAQLATEAAAAPLPVCLSFMAHSFGGIIERECVYLLLLDTTETRAQNAALYVALVHLRRRLREMHVHFENFLNVATPHCGTGECLWWPIYFGAWCLARLRLCQTYDELILSDADRVLQTRLLDGPHLQALELFRRRVLFANTHRDLLVGFGTCSLIFENVDTDHTKFVGVAAGETPCAAAFADDTIEISKPIVLRSFAEEEAEEKDVECRCSDSAVRRLRSCASSAERRTYTLHDVDAALVFESAADAESPVRTTSGEGEGGGREDDEEDEPADGSEISDVVHLALKHCDVLSGTLRPKPTFSSLPGLTASSISMVSAATAGQDSACAASFTVGQSVPSHAIEEVPLESIVGCCSSSREDDDDSEEGDRSPTDTVTAVVDAAASPSEDFEVGYDSLSSMSVSPVSLLARPISVVYGSHSCDGHARYCRYSPSNAAAAGVTLFGSPRGNAQWGSDSDSASSSRRSRGSHVVSVLTDPRWASEHVRHAASVVHSEVRQRLHTAAAVLRRRIGDANHDDTLLPTERKVERGRAVFTSPPAATNDDATCFGPSASSYLVPSDDIPQYRKTPRAIAARLREKLSWRVRAVRFDNVIPVGHVACLGNWAFCGRSPLLVQSVAEELLIILD
ncbi:hypothetical protein ABB37_02117 [Leptomonas pyrrhocoris]|uniref:DUF676 domain-containing protein n=1 Tax=Leptomonas pyrrhocoris TaxID=157538 RepID=A0A0M9G7A0_LEPPY|nr:hypothetical protein ABB37_02117 [Leptomonas pyrrhocoris]KPA83973.1 hypothetical protein ABB37_02117 [Leptomonas pyrrhocoris]|eukprot:XP_015662412.1 hypothetical protein ABB37_02117 [Leptomonas pyrrhocoris]